MKKVLSSLYELQRIEILSHKSSTTDGTKLRQQIPAELLDIYERFRARDRKAVAVVRNNVCGECHLRIPVGTLVHLMHGEVHRCGNCGRLLYLPEGTPVTVSASSSAPPTAPIQEVQQPPRKRRKKAEPVAQAA